jgi:hypothetical protein
MRLALDDPRSTEREGGNGHPISIVAFSDEGDPPSMNSDRLGELNNEVQQLEDF